MVGFSTLHIHIPDSEDDAFKVGRMCLRGVEETCARDRLARKHEASVARTA